MGCQDRPSKIGNDVEILLIQDLVPIQPRKWEEKPIKGKVKDTTAKMHDYWSIAPSMALCWGAMPSKDMDLWKQVHNSWLLLDNFTMSTTLSRVPFEHFVFKEKKFSWIERTRLDVSKKPRWYFCCVLICLLDILYHCWGFLWVQRWGVKCRTQEMNIWAHPSNG